MMMAMAVVCGGVLVGCWWLGAWVGRGEEVCVAVRGWAVGWMGWVKVGKEKEVDEVGVVMKMVCVREIKVGESGWTG